MQIISVDEALERAKEVEKHGGETNRLVYYKNDMEILYTNEKIGARKLTVGTKLDSIILNTLKSNGTKHIFVFEKDDDRTKLDQFPIRKDAYLNVLELNKTFLQEALVEPEEIVNTIDKNSEFINKIINFEIKKSNFIKNNFPMRVQGDELSLHHIQTFLLAVKIALEFIDIKNKKLSQINTREARIWKRKNIEEMLINIGFGSMLHDIGFIRVDQLVYVPDRIIQDSELIMDFSEEENKLFHEYYTYEKDEESYYIKQGLDIITMAKLIKLFKSKSDYKEFTERSRELGLLKQHHTKGKSIFAKALVQTRGAEDIKANLDIIRDIIENHHFDLPGEKEYITLTPGEKPSDEARIVGIAAHYDSLTTNKNYRRNKYPLEHEGKAHYGDYFFTHEEACEKIFHKIRETNQKRFESKIDPDLILAAKTVFQY